MAPVLTRAQRSTANEALRQAQELPLTETQYRILCAMHKMRKGTRDELRLMCPDIRRPQFEAEVTDLMTRKHIEILTYYPLADDDSLTVYKESSSGEAARKRSRKVYAASAKLLNATKSDAIRLIDLIMLAD